MPKTTATADTISPQIPPAITYRLSEKYFLDVGWTTRPFVAQQVHHVVTMKAKFLHSTICSWFKERNEDAIGHYSNGQILYNAKKNGTGKIFYPNGRIAIKIEKGGVNMLRSKIWVYNPGEVDRDGKLYRAKFCALFDSSGNGVVYDEFLNKKLVYNQEEGALYDSSKGITMRWKWHNIQCSYIAEDVFEDNNYEGSLIQDVPKSLMRAPHSVETDIYEKKTSGSPNFGLYDSMRPLSNRDIKFLNRIENVRYVNTGKLNPREVAAMKPICLRLNKYLALRIFDQSDITLSFFANGSHTHIKIGILFNPYDKLKTTKLEMPPKSGEILFAYENFPPKTQSLLKFQKLMKKLKRNLCAGND